MPGCPQRHSGLGLQLNYLGTNGQYEQCLSQSQYKVLGCHEQVGRQGEGVMVDTSVNCFLRLGDVFVCSATVDCLWDILLALNHVIHVFILSRD